MDLASLALQFPHEGLAYYAMVGDEAGARGLLDAGLVQDIDWRDDNGFTALVLAAANGHSSIVDLLLERGAEVDASPESTAMMIAVANAHAHVVPHLIRGGADVLCKDINGLTAFAQACNAGQIEVVITMVETLQALGANDTVMTLVETSADVGLTPLILAASNDHLEIVMYLIELGADVHRQNDQAFDALLGAAQYGSSDVVQYLLGSGANVETMNSSRETPLILASAQGHVDVVDILLGAGADVNHKTANGQCALHHCVMNGHAEIASRLIRAGTDVMMERNDGCTSFFLACKDGMTSVVKAMLEAVADMGDPGVMAAMVNTTRLDGTALIAASHYGHLDIVKLLVAYGVNVQATNANGEDALRIAVEANQLDTVQYLLANGGTSDSRNASNRTPLMYASATGNVEMVHALIDGEAQTNLIDGVDARTALWKAACDGHCDIIDCLLEAHADIDFQDARGYTPLMAAAVNGHDAAVALLVQRQAGLDLRDLVGATALFYAATKGHTAIVRILLEAGADHRHELSPPANGNALHHASQHGHEDVVQALIHHGADVNATTSIGLTALMASATKGHAEISLLLLRNGAEVDAQDVNGMTALHFAVISRSVDTIRALIQAGASARIKDKAGSSPLYQALLMGEFELVTLLEETVSSSTLDEDITNAVWPIRTLYELYDRADTEWRSEGPSWYIDASVIEEASLARQQILPTAVVNDGRWLGSNVTLIKPSFGAPIEIEHLTSKKHVSKEMFAAAVLRWFPLSHPHVLKLFGANHRNQQFLVAEHSQGTLRSYLKARPHLTWRTLHQIALGLQYLHERAIIHGNIHGDIISFSEDGLPKIGGLGIFDATNVSSSRLNWWSPESLSDTEFTYETDIYSFGMLIIEAISGDVPYAAEVEAGADIKKLIMECRIPTRHEAFSDRGWELVKSLTMGLPTERLSVDALVLELEDLATEEEQQLVSIIAPTSLDQVKLRFEQAQVLTSLHSDAVHLSLLEQLSEIMQGLQVLQKSERKPAVMSRCLAVVDRFILHLEARSALSTAQTHSSGRQHAAKIKSLFNDVERLVDELHSVRPFKERGWREVWNQWSTEQQRKFGVELEAVTQYVPQSKLEEAHIEQLSCMLFEITKHRSRYGVISHEVTRNATTKIINILGGPLPEWFFPWYEVALATSKPFSKGGFGEVYRGKWMGSHVVVKKCIAFDQKVFVREVELWFKLDHPHVVKLFGACHVGQKFFVAEWAEHGQLDTYLARNKKLGRSVMWQKLHEAALGLRYLHVRGIIHRDLKCNNILVGRDETAKITDFGLSSPSEQSDDVVVTQTFGNARWAAPEVLAGGMPSYASDVFSFGMSIVEAVTGRVPYAETRDRSVVAASVAAGDFLVRPRCFERDDHWTLVTRCCAFDPAERVDMDEVIATLSTFADEEVHRHHNEILLGSKSESVVREPETILESTKEESMLVSKASRRDSQGAPANDLSTILTSMREVGEVDIAPESPDLFISDASRRESHALEAGDHESSHGWSAMSHIYEAQSSMAEVEEDGLSGATVYYSAWSHDEKPKARDVDSNASTASTSTASTSLDSPSASGA